MSLDRFLQLLEPLGLTSQQLAEALYLARFLEPGTGRLDASAVQSRPTADPADAEAERLAAARPRSETETQTALYRDTSGREPLDGPGGSRPARVPAARALPEQLELMRALRPLGRPFPSRTASVVDEEATAEYVARTGIRLPVLVPDLARRFELSLVVDESASMTAWASLAEEFAVIAAQTGAFRAVAVWSLTGTDQGAAELAPPGAAGRAAAPRRLEELGVPDGSRLVLVISDCVADAWHRGGVSRALHRLAATTPTAVLQPFPRRQWRRTGARPTPGTLVMTYPGRAEYGLRFRPREHVTPGSPTGSRVPLVAIGDKRMLAEWAEFLVGSRLDLVCASLGMPDADQEPAVPSQSLPTDPRELLRRFRASSSQAAYTLATYISPTQLNLPIMRWIQRTVLPHTGSEVLAEVISGGLLRSVPPEAGAGRGHPDPEANDFEFVDPALRGLLGEALRDSDKQWMLEGVGQRLADRVGVSAKTFTAAISVPPGGGHSAVDLGHPFAYMSPRALRVMTGSFLYGTNVAPVTDPERVAELASAARSLREGLGGETEGWKLAVDAYERAIDAMPQPDVLLRELLAEHAQLRSDYAVVTASTDDLDLAIRAWQDTVTWALPGTHAMAAALSGLADALTARWRACGQIDYLEDAVRKRRHAVDTLQPDDPEASRYLHKLGDTLRDRYDATRDPTFATESLSVLRSAQEAATPETNGAMLNTSLAASALAVHDRTQALENLDMALRQMQIAAGNPPRDELSAYVEAMSALSRRLLVATHDRVLLAEGGGQLLAAARNVERMDGVEEEAAHRLRAASELLTGRTRERGNDR